MRVLIVGHADPFALETYYAGHLSALGVEVSIFNTGEHYKARSMMTRVGRRLGIMSIYRPVNTALLLASRESRPDIIWIFKGVEWYPRTLEALRLHGARLVNYNPDHPFIRTSVSHGSSVVEKNMSRYDLHFTYHATLHEDLKHLGFKSVLLPFGYEPSNVHNESPIPEEEIFRVCMIGHADRTRARVIRKLLKAGLDVDVFGSGWGRYLKESAQCRIGGMVTGDQFWRKMRVYRVQLNLFRPHNIGSHNMRTFEIPSIGGLQLTPYSNEQASFFEDGAEVWFYRDRSELTDKARFLLSLDKAEADSFRLRAAKRSLTSGYSYDKRASIVYEAFSDLLAGC